MRWNAESAQPATHPLRLLIADRQPLVRAGLAALLTADGHCIVTEAGDGDVAQLLSQHAIDIVILDIDLDGLNPAALTTARLRHLPVIILAPAPDHPGIAPLIHCGIAGLALKSEGAGVMRQCIGSVATGARWIDPRALAHGMDRVRASHGNHHLTRRERDVARLVATGQRNRAIAGALGISEGTVKMHLHNVFAKLGLESRTQLAMEMRAS